MSERSSEEPTPTSENAASPAANTGDNTGDNTRDNTRDTATKPGRPQNGPDRRGPPPNPIHHPLFLPILLVAFTLWFGFDGFLTTDPEMLEHQNFNRIMYLLMQPICFRAVPRGIQEFLEDQQAAAAA